VKKGVGGCWLVGLAHEKKPCRLKSAGRYRVVENDLNGGDSARASIENRALDAVEVGGVVAGGSLGRQAADEFGADNE
jgi:hypothetical protein